MEDNENNENTKTDASLIGSGEHDVLSLIFRQLNWDVINFMNNKDLIARIRLYVSYLCFRLLGHVLRDLSTIN